MRTAMVECSEALLALSNMGMDLPSRTKVQEYLREGHSYRYYMYLFAGPYMENQEHEDAFMDEAAGWHGSLTEEDIQKYPRIWRLVCSDYEYQRLSERAFQSLDAAKVKLARLRYWLNTDKDVLEEMTAEQRNDHEYMVRLVNETNAVLEGK